MSSVSAVGTFDVSLTHMTSCKYGITVYEFLVKYGFLFGPTVHILISSLSSTVTILLVAVEHNLPCLCLLERHTHSILVMS